jgi:hypothetical protein
MWKWVSATEHFYSRIPIEAYTVKQNLVVCAPTDRKRFYGWYNRFLRQRTKSVVITDLSVKATDTTVVGTDSGQLEHKPNFSLVQQILFFSVDFNHDECCPAKFTFFCILFFFYSYFLFFFF